MADAVFFLARAEQRGGHVHVDLWAGNASQTKQQARPRLGHLIMDPHQWEALTHLLMQGDGPGHRVDIEEYGPGGVRGAERG